MGEEAPIELEGEQVQKKREGGPKEREWFYEAEPPPQDERMGGGP